MKETPPPILSSYLLREAEKFFPYPNKNRRTHGWIAFQKKGDDKIRELAEWRKTFTPLPNSDLFDAFAFLLDELYCRDVLKKIPEFVERTRRLSNLTLAGIPDRDSLAYLIESANCYIGGSTLVAVALARAAIEVSLRKSAAKVVGEKQAYAADLKEVIDEYCVRRGRLLSREAADRAHHVRRAANDALHHISTRPVDVLPVLEAARAVILELGRRAGPEARRSNSALQRARARVARSGR